jgi:SH3-like domain-containing protein
LLGACAAPVFACPIKSIGVAAAVLYDGPSSKAKKMFIAPRGMPVEVLSVVEPWAKIRDFTGDVLWVARNELSDLRTLIATRVTPVRTAADDYSAPLFNAERGLVLEFLETAAAGGWLRVRHRDGTVGYIREADVWGL